jgi:hypothetical protein
MDAHKRELQRFLSAPIRVIRGLLLRMTLNKRHSGQAGMALDLWAAQRREGANLNRKVIVLRGSEYLAPRAIDPSSKFAQILPGIGHEVFAGRHDQYPASPKLGGFDDSHFTDGRVGHGKLLIENPALPVMA